MIAKSFERIHRSNLVGMGIVPLCFKFGEDMGSLGLTGHEQYTIHLPTSVREMRPDQDIVVATNTKKSFTCILRFDTEVNEAFAFDYFIVWGNPFAAIAISCNPLFAKFSMANKDDAETNLYICRCSCCLFSVRLIANVAFSCQRTTS